MWHLRPRDGFALEPSNPTKLAISDNLARRPCGITSLLRGCPNIEAQQLRGNGPPHPALTKIEAAKQLSAFHLSGIVPIHYMQVIFFN
jgi:hypothetical protein